MIRGKKTEKSWWNRWSICIVFWIYSTVLHRPYTDSSWEMSNHPYDDTTVSTPHALQKRGCWGVSRWHQLTPSILKCPYSTELPLASKASFLIFQGQCQVTFPLFEQLHCMSFSRVKWQNQAVRCHISALQNHSSLSANANMGGLKGEASLKPFSENQEYSLEDPLPHSKLHLTQYIDLGWIDESLSALISFIYISVGIKQLSHFGIQLCTLFMCVSQCPSTAKF